MTDLPDFLQRDEFGGVRLTGHRIALYHLIWHYNQGYSAEMLLGQFPTLPLSLIHKTIGYYLENQASVDEYLRAVEAKIEQQRVTGTTLNVDELRTRFNQLQGAEAKTLRAG